MSVIRTKSTPDERAGRRRTRRLRVFRRALPPPDPSTRVELDLPHGAAAGTSAARPNRTAGELTVLAGLAGILAAVASQFAELVDLPSSSEVSVASFGVALVGLGVVQRRRFAAPVVVAAAEEITAEHALPPDLPSLTGEIATLLSQLRHDYGLAYRSATWLDSVLPGVGFAPADAELARDVLAVSALDAGGIRADVAALTATHPMSAIVEAASALLVALGNVRDACQQREIGIGELPQSDPSSWTSVLV